MECVITRLVKATLKGLPLPELEAEITAQGHRAFRARQLFKWINQDRVNSFEQMTDLSKAFRAELAQKYEMPTISIIEKQESADGTIKFLVGLPDGEKVESVYIPQEDRKTLCVSTQVGCKMGCTFCATAYQGFTRNLKSWEIVEQLIALPVPERVTNIVLMGMGEPLDNYEEVRRALAILQDPMGPKIGKRHITLSTVGLSEKIKRFVDDDLGKLAISLHGTTDEQRAKIMPVNRKYPIGGLMELCRTLQPYKHRFRVTFEYLLIKDFNDTDEDARRLAKLMVGIPAKINLLAYNENPFVDFKRPSEERVLAFQNILLNQGMTATYRRSRGRDIAAACGQLRTAVKLKSKPQAVLPAASLQ